MIAIKNAICSAHNILKGRFNNLIIAVIKIPIAMPNMYHPPKAIMIANNVNKIPNTAEGVWILVTYLSLICAAAPTNAKGAPPRKNKN